MNFGKFLIQSPKIPLFFAGILVVLGGISTNLIPKEDAPYVEMGIVNITTSHLGVGAEDIDETITEKIESKITSVSGIDTYSSTSREGMSQITINLETDADSSEVVSDLRSAVDDAKSELPSDLDYDPRVTEIDSSRGRPFLQIAIMGDTSPVELSSVARELGEKIEKISGVGGTSINGELLEEVHINIDKQKLESLGLSFSQVSEAIRNIDRNTPLGTFDNGGKEYSIRFEGERKSIDDFLNIIVAKLGDQESPTIVRVKDIADLEKGSQDNPPISRFFSTDFEGGGKTAAILTVTVSGGGNIFNTQKQTEALAEEFFKKEGYKDFSYEFFQESTVQMKESYKNLATSFAFSIVVVMLSIFFFVGIREGLVASAVIPLAFLGSFLALYLTGRTMNFMVNFSMVLSLGILVDTAIVMVEGTALFIKKGFAPKEAAYKSFMEFRAPLFSGMLTTLAVFFPLVFVSGPTGKYLTFIPITMLFVLSISLIVSLYFIPALSGVTMKGEKKNPEKIEDESLHSKNPQKNPENQKSSREKIEAMIDSIIEKYVSLLRAAISSFTTRWFIFLSVVLIFIGTFFLKIPFVFMPNEDSDYLTVNIELPTGSQREDTEIMSQKLEKYIEKLPELEIMTSKVQDNTSTIFLQLIPFKERAAIGGMRTSVELKDMIVKEFSDLPSHITLQAKEQAKGPPGGSPVGFRIQIADASLLEEGRKVTEELTALIKKEEGTQGVSNSINEAPGEFRFVTDEEKAWKNGINPAVIPGIIRGALYGSTVSTFTKNGDDVDIKLQFAPDDIQTIDDILSIEVANTIPLSELVSVTTENSLSQIDRHDGEVVFTVSSLLKKGENAQEITNSILKKLEGENAPSWYKNISQGIFIENASENAENMDLIIELIFGGIIGIFLILFILVVQFKSYSPPLLILITILFAQIGVGIGLWLTGTPRSLPYILGFISLSGIIVNDAIILVDKIIKNVQSQNFSDTIEAILDAGKTRFVPVILTTITTSAGIAPLIFIDAFWAGIAYTIIFGLSVSSLLTLFLIPVGYLLFQKTEKK
jgi:HAE1 family hydrophobic/amphiphilic exporter-1